LVLEVLVALETLLVVVLALTLQLLAAQQLLLLVAGMVEDILLRVVLVVLVVGVVTVVQAVQEHRGKALLEALEIQAVIKVLVVVVAQGLLEQMVRLLPVVLVV
jgi:hypothetical protein